MTEDLQKKVERAVKLLRSYRGGQPIEVSYSGGKDSDVILELVKMSGIPYRAIYKNTTIDPVGTIKHCKEMGVEIRRPKVDFFHLIQKKGFPTMFKRFCCQYLKEYKVLDNAVQGIRRGESVKRAKRYQEPIVCRIYGGNKKNHVNIYLPILEWTAQDVKEFIEERGIKCHPLYYDEQGNFHPERRLGCMGCPFKPKHGIYDFKEKPKLLRAWTRSAMIWWNTTRPDAPTKKKFQTIYDVFFSNTFCNSYQEYLEEKHNLFETLDCKKFLEEYFGVDLTF